jgi:hypothetical protein
MCEVLSLILSTRGKNFHIFKILLVEMVLHTCDPGYQEAEEDSEASLAPWEV